MKLIPVENQQGLYRDVQTNAIINKNKYEYENYLKQRNIRLSKNEKIDELENQVLELKQDISEIKELIKYFINK